MQGIVVNTIVYPMKGLHGIETPNRGIRTSISHGVEGDRTFAIYRKSGALPTSWKSKVHFRICMNTEGMAIPHSLTAANLDAHFRLTLDQVHRLITEQGLDIEVSSIVDTGGMWHLADTPKPYVSFLNLASVRALGEFIGEYIDPRRFRMNVWVDGLDPWAELSYVRGFEQGRQYPMSVGSLNLYIDDLCERCRATEQNPETGLWDLDILKALQLLLKDRGYKGSPHRGTFVVMGWLAIPQENAVIRIGDKVLFE